MGEGGCLNANHNNNIANTEDGWSGVLRQSSMVLRLCLSQPGFSVVSCGFDLKQQTRFCGFCLEKGRLSEKRQQKVKAIKKRVENVIADPSDLSLVSLVTQICSFSAEGTTERERERQREREYISRVRGCDKHRSSGRGPAMGLGCYSSSFYSGENGVSDLHYAASYQLYFR